ncbi:uncharacterized protein [Glycine max]|uniref:uncharacterized protein n=1 Tax=Glycine max TaxID=3847 RepID=UPI001B357F2F|nr:uncharacterized protein LOC121174244 [Glycine max]
MRNKRSPSDLTFSASSLDRRSPPVTSKVYQKLWEGGNLTSSPSRRVVSESEIETNTDNESESETENEECKCRGSEIGIRAGPAIIVAAADHRPPPPATARRLRPLSAALRSPKSRRIFFFGVKMATSCPVFSFSGTPTIATAKLNWKNYLSWSASVELWFLGQGYDHLEKNINVVPNDKKLEWEKVDYQLCAVLWQSVESDVLEILRSFKTCHLFWKKTQEIFANNIQSLFDAIVKVTALKQSNHDMIAHMGKARAAVEELRRFLVADSLEEVNRKNVHEALSHPGWRQAMIDEMQALENNGTWELVSLPPGKKTVGCRWVYSGDGVVISQRKYALNILEETSMQNCRPVDSPMDPNLKLLADQSEMCPDPERYIRLVGKLIYLTITRPDISFAVGVVSQFMQNPRVDHWNAVMRILRYIKRALGQGLLYEDKGNTQVSGYCDADWAGCPMDRRSTSEYCVSIGGNAISWKSKKHTVVARSSAEAEYRSMAMATCELMWIKQLLQELRFCEVGQMKLYCDNQAPLHIASNPVFHERTKHIEIDCHFIREKLLSKEIITEFISSNGQLADILTKSL